MSLKIPIIKNIVSGSDQSKFILVIGDYEINNPLPMVTAFLHSNIQTEKHVLIANYGYPQKWINLATIHISWGSNCQELLSYCDEIITKRSENPILLVIKDIDLLLWKFKSSTVLSCFKKLFSYPNLKSLVLIVNNQAHSLVTIESLKYLATTTIHIIDCQIQRSIITNLCKVNHKKKSGKISSDSGKYLCKFSSHDLNLVSCCTSSVDQVITELNPNESSNQMNNLTTFNLEINESEKSARSQLVLPYIKSDDIKNEELQGGKVLYNPDQYDDIDEEDPDDDLDI